MRAANPLLVESWRGLAAGGDARMSYLGYLVVQALVLAAWWPWGEVQRVIATQSEPKALLAVVIALGACLSLQGIRAGAEEVLLPGQRPLREWMVGTPLGAARIVAGHLGAQLLQTCHATLLSLPLVLAGYAVSSAEATALAWALATAVLMALLFRVVGTFCYLLLGHRATGIYVLLRVIVVTSWAVPALALPAASHPRLSHALLVEADTARLAVGGLPAQLVFVAVYGVAVAAFTMAVYRLVSRHRRAAGEAPPAPRRGTPGRAW